MLEVSGLTVSYGPIEAVREISFRVEEGAVVSLVGPNGAGKTTTLNAVSGVVPAHARPGSFSRAATSPISGRTSGCRPASSRSPRAGWCCSGMTVRENLEMGAYRRPAGEIDDGVRRMEARFPILRERRNAMAATLSGGEQQMLAIARGLMAKPRLLLLDEPSLGLAPLLVRVIFEIVSELRAEGLTILLVEQNARQALAVSAHAYVMENGKVVLEGLGRAADVRSGHRQHLPRPGHRLLKRPG